jgi:CPA2 family monovalent cation:H+ antiporter-2
VPYGDLFKDLMIVLAVAGIVVPVFGRLSFTSVAAFLIAGTIVGPGGLGRFTGAVPWLEWVSFSDPERVQPFADLGVLFLLFLIGLGFPLRRLLNMKKLVLGLGSAQVLATTAVVAVIAYLYGAGPGVAVALGLGFALSSTAIVSQLLAEQRRLATPVGRAAMAVLLFQDAMVAPIVIIIGLLARGLTALPTIAWAIPLAIAAMAVIAIAAQFLVGPLIRLAARHGGREAVVAIALFHAVAIALLTQAVGLSTALGAFLAGILIGETEYRHQIEVDIEPFKGLLLGLFFMTVGMSFDPALLFTAFAAVVGSVVGLVLIKSAVMFPLALAFGSKRPAAAEIAVVLAGAGEFAFVVLTLSRDAGLMTPADDQFFVAVAALGLLVTPGLAFIGARLSGRLEARPGGAEHAPDEAAVDLSDHVVIGGFGRIGRLIADILDAERIPYVALDRDADLVAAERAAGRPVFYGDATRREMLDRVGGGRARAFVVTTDEAEAEEAMVGAIRQAWPEAVIHARAKNQAHAQHLREIGADTAVPEALEASLQMAAEVLAGMGLREAAILTRLAQQRRSELETMQVANASPPPGAAPPGGQSPSGQAGV